MIEDLFITPSQQEKDIVHQCAICRKWKNEHNEYQKIADPIETEIELHYLVSHGYCEPCFKLHMEEMDNEYSRGD